MSNSRHPNRAVWLTIGVLAGLCLSYLLPHEPAQATTTDRNSKFALVTTEVSFAGEVEGIFVLDFLTGQLHGGVMNPQAGKFTHRYMRNIAADFNVNPQATPHYAIVSGRARLTGTRGVTPATCVIYIAELTSGRVVGYGFPYKVSNRPIPNVIPLAPMDSFQFREALQAE